MLISPRCYNNNHTGGWYRPPDFTERSADAITRILSPELYPIFWLFLAIALAIVEAVSIQLVAIWFALGAVSAIIPAMLGTPMWVQFLVFALVSAIAMACTRPFVKRFLQMRGERTNADRVVGETGIVLEAIDNLAGHGRVNALGLDWTARSADGSLIEAGTPVLVHAIEGVKLIVSKADGPAQGPKKEDSL